MSCHVYKKIGSATYVIASRSFWNKARKRTECVTAYLGILGGDGREYLCEEAKQGYIGVEVGQYTSVRRCRRDMREHPEWFENGGRGRGNVKAPNAPEDTDGESSDGANHGTFPPLHPPPPEAEEESRTLPRAVRSASPGSGKPQAAMAAVPPGNDGGHIVLTHVAGPFGTHVGVTILPDEIQFDVQHGKYGCTSCDAEFELHSVTCLDFLRPSTAFPGTKGTVGIHRPAGFWSSNRSSFPGLDFLPSCSRSDNGGRSLVPYGILPVFANDSETHKLFERRNNYLGNSFNERIRRVFAAVDAVTFGRHLIPTLCDTYGIGKSTIYRGINEIETLTKSCEVIPKSAFNRVRREGGGRKPIQQTHPRICEYIVEYVSPDARGDPENPMQYASSSVRNIVEYLMVRYKIQVSPTTVLKLLKLQGYSLQGVAKVIEGTEYPYRQEQFRLIEAIIASCKKHGFPIISVDTKNKILVGRFGPKGRKWQIKGEPEEALDHDFESQAEGKGVPYGVYSIHENKGFMFLGNSCDTSEFAVNSVSTWWEKYGKLRFPNARKLFITCDCGGSNGYRVKLWKKMLQDFSNKSGLIIFVLHYPPGSSKWNKIEHALFSFISKVLRATILLSLEIIINCFRATVTEQGLCVKAELDDRVYEKGIKVAKSVMDGLNIIHFKKQPKLNYIIRPQKFSNAA
jgi:hypothetical protein